MTEEVLLGFDAREMWLTGMRESGPGGGRPTQFLLRTDLDDILSADTMVWPSTYKSIGMNAPFWEDLSTLRDAISEEFGVDRPY